MTEQDAAWMARILARFGDAHVKALVETGRLENTVMREELERILLGRRDALLARYLESRSPLTLPRVVDGEGGAQLCLEDLVVTARRAEPGARRYRAQAWAGESLRALPAPPVARGSAGAAQDVCVPLPGELGGSEGRPAYLVLDVEASGPRAAPPARVHLYHLGAERFSVVGLERPERADAPKP
jgi:hypothetical protein